MFNYQVYKKNFISELTREFNFYSGDTGIDALGSCYMAVGAKSSASALFDSGLINVDQHFELIELINIATTKDSHEY